MNLYVPDHTCTMEARVRLLEHKMNKLRGFKLVETEDALSPESLGYMIGASEGMQYMSVDEIEIMNLDRKILKWEAPEKQ